MASFSLTEKLAVTGAFLAVVALAVGTEDDPGLVVTGQETVTQLRPAAPIPAPLAPTVQAQPQPPAPEPVEQPAPVATVTATATTGPGNGVFDPELGRVPLDFSNGPPPG